MRHKADCNCNLASLINAGTGSLEMRKTNWLDGLAVGASFACMVHCLILPLAMAALPALSQFIDIPESFHLIVLAVAFPTSALALAQGYRSHGTIFPAMCGIVGLMFLAFGITEWADENTEKLLTITGGLLLAAAHIANWRLRGRKRYRIT